MILVVGHVAVPMQRPLDKDSHSAPAEQDDSEFKKIPLVPEVRPLLLLQ